VVALGPLVQWENTRPASEMSPVRIRQGPPIIDVFARKRHRDGRMNRYKLSFDYDGCDMELDEDGGVVRYDDAMAEIE